MKKTYIALMFLFVISGLISCQPTEQPKSEDIGSQPISKLIEKNVVLANGIDFDTGKLVSIDPYTGEEITPCLSGQPATDSKETKQGQQTLSSCKAPVMLSGESLNHTFLQDALKSSGQPIMGKVKVNGEEKDARFVITVTALYKGSHCTTTYSAGDERTQCINTELMCQLLRKKLKQPNFPC